MLYERMKTIPTTKVLKCSFVDGDAWRGADAEEEPPDGVRDRGRRRVAATAAAGYKSDGKSMDIGRSVAMSVGRSICP